MIEPSDGLAILAVMTTAMARHPEFFKAKPAHENAGTYVERKAKDGDETALAIIDEFKAAGLLDFSK